MTGESFNHYQESIKRAKRSLLDEREAEERARRVNEAKKNTSKERPREQRDESDLYDKSLVKLTITNPEPTTDEVHIFLVDNSGSNRQISQHFKKSSGYLSSTINGIDPRSQIASIYFSDHCDGDNLMQEIDFVLPNIVGDKIIYSTLQHVSDAGGGDAPEAIECVLLRACDLNFGNATKRHLYLVTDVVGHGMGMDGDSGCPNRVDWRKSVERVRKIFTTFQVISCTNDPDTVRLQKQFLSPERVPFDLIDFSNIRESLHRNSITVNALLFLIARQKGLQTVEMFLGMLYEKWLSDPVFGDQSDRLARERISSFADYLEISDKQRAEMLEKILV